MIGLVPFTVAFILPVEDPLLEREAALSNGHAPEASPGGRKEKTGAADDTLVLLKKWTFRNYIRTIVPALGVATAWTLA
jgi:hypothetical protein